MLSQTALRELSIAAQFPGVVFSASPNNPYDAPVVAELEPLGLIQPEKPGWFEVSEAGYQFIEAQGISVWRLSAKVAA